MSDIYRCIPFRYINSDEDGNSKCGKVIQVLMISSSSGPGLLFPKVQSKMPFLHALSFVWKRSNIFNSCIHIGRLGE